MSDFQQLLHPCPVEPSSWDGSFFASSLSSSCSSSVFESYCRRAPVGRAVYVHLRLVNPLQLRVECKNVRLYGSIEASVKLQPSYSSSSSSTSARSSEVEETRNERRDEMIPSNEGNLRVLREDDKDNEDRSGGMEKGEKKVTSLNHQKASSTFSPSSSSSSSSYRGSVRSVTFPVLPKVVLEPQASVLLTLLAIPHIPGKLIIKGKEASEPRLK